MFMQAFCNEAEKSVVQNDVTFDPLLEWTRAYYRRARLNRAARRGESSAERTLWVTTGANQGT